MPLAWGLLKGILPTMPTCSHPDMGPFFPLSSPGSLGALSLGRDASWKVSKSNSTNGLAGQMVEGVLKKSGDLGFDPCTGGTLGTGVKMPTSQSRGPSSPGQRPDLHLGKLGCERCVVIGWGGAGGGSVPGRNSTVLRP